MSKKRKQMTKVIIYITFISGFISSTYCQTDTLRKIYTMFLVVKMSAFREIHI
jgi:hypothetical protein